MDRNGLRGRIIAKGFSIDAFCKAIGMTRVTFNRRMSGKTEFTRDEIAKIMEVLELTVEEMYSIFFIKKVA